MCDYFQVLRVSTLGYRRRRASVWIVKFPYHVYWVQSTRREPVSEVSLSRARYARPGSQVTFAELNGTPQRRWAYLVRAKSIQVAMLHIPRDATLGRQHQSLAVKKGVSISHREGVSGVPPQSLSGNHSCHNSIGCVRVSVVGFTVRVIIHAVPLKGRSHPVILILRDSPTVANYWWLRRHHYFQCLTPLQYGRVFTEVDGGLHI